MSNQPDSAVAAPDFRTEFTQCWQQLPNKGLFFALLGAWLLLFQFLGNSTFGYVDTPSLLHWMYNAYIHSDGSEQHGLLVPILVLGLFWWKRKQLLALPHRLWTPLLIVVAMALALHVFGYLMQQPRISIVAFFMGIYALMGLVWGPAWLRASFFPFFLFLFCIPISSIAEPVTLPMRVLSSRIVELLAHAVGIDVAREGTQLFNAGHGYRYEVAAACSGLRSTMAVLCLGTVYGFVVFEKNWKRILLMASAFPLAVLGNVIRLMLIIVAAEVSGQSAGDYVHENWFFSLVPYIPAIVGVLLLGHWLRERQVEPTPPALKPEAA